MTYLHRTQPEAASIVLRPVQSKCSSPSPHCISPCPKLCSLGNSGSGTFRGYLGHRRKSPLAFRFWRGWLQLESLCEGWQLCSSLNWVSALKFCFDMVSRKDDFSFSDVGNREFRKLITTKLIEFNRAKSSKPKPMVQAMIHQRQ